MIDSTVARGVEDLDAASNSRVVRMYGTKKLLVPASTLLSQARLIDLYQQFNSAQVYLIAQAQVTVAWHTT